MKNQLEYMDILEAQNPCGQKWKIFTRILCRELRLVKLVTGVAE